MEGTGGNVDKRGRVAGAADSGVGVDWKEVDAQLRRLARQSAAQDWEIGGALLLARQSRAHERLGYASLFEYVERLFGYTPRVTAERLRVADALHDLPELDRALRVGERCWSAIREISRIAAPETEHEWLEFSAGRTVRELEQAVSGLRPGDRPGDPPDPHLQRRVIRLDVGPEAFGLYRDAVALLRREGDSQLTEEDALMELCRRTLGGTVDSTRPPYQVALTLCDHCGRTWQDAGGETLELPPEVGERALCDAQVLGDVPARTSAGSAPRAEPADGQSARRSDATEASHGAAPSQTSDGEPGPDTHVGRQRASRTIPPAVRRLVLRRDGGRCRAPGCRNHTWLNLHHIVPRSEGGGNDAANILVLCGRHHALHHCGLLLIDLMDGLMGGATEAEVRFAHADGTPYGDAPRPLDVQAHSEAYAALRSLGFGETESRQSLATARAHVGVGATPEALVTAALRSLHGQRRAA